MWKNEHIGDPIVRLFAESQSCQEILVKLYHLYGEREKGKGAIPISKGLSGCVVKGN